MEANVAAVSKAVKVVRDDVGIVSLGGHVSLSAHSSGPVFTCHALNFMVRLSNPAGA